jgi:ketosteroid isomerase-like protein
VASIDRHSNSGIPSVTPMDMQRVIFPVSRDRCLAIGVALAVLLLAAPVLPAMPRAEKHEMRHQIEHLEDVWRNAMLKGNISALDALLADDYIAITPTGILQSKEQTLDNLRSGNMHFKSIALTDRKIRMYGTTALVTSRAEVNATATEGEEVSGSYRYTRVYVKDPRGVWRVVSFEASRIKEPGETH